MQDREQEIPHFLALSMTKAERYLQAAVFFPHKRIEQGASTGGEVAIREKESPSGQRPLSSEEVVQMLVAETVPNY